MQNEGGESARYHLHSRNHATLRPDVGSNLLQSSSMRIVDKSRMSSAGKEDAILQSQMGQHQLLHKGRDQETQHTFFPSTVFTSGI